MKPAYLSPSEAREILSSIDPDLIRPDMGADEEEHEESEYQGRSAYALACRFQHDVESFEEGQPLFGLHPAHAGQVANMNRQPLGWSW